jgi:fibronectin type 3 domain-containing protein
VKGAPAQSNSFGTAANANTTLATTPVSREKPYLYVDSSSNYNVFVPTVLTNSSGTDWTANGGLGTGYSLAISTFLIATPSTSLATINSALASGENLILTPGIYKYSGAINVTNAKTIVLGLGYPTLVPQSGTAAITVADVDGVQLAGLLIDAGPVNSPVLLQVGVAGGSRVSHASDPTSINDVYFRIGGATAGTAATAMEIDSDNVILDNIWAWRADHGTDATWTGNVAMHGLVVNGDNVTALGLAVEHFEEEQVVWNGEGGETIFYQSEMPYDVPSEAAWMDNGVDGYASYNVAPTVTSHLGYGIGVYSYFNQGVDIIANSGIAAPVASGVKFTDALTVWLAGSGQITYTIASNNGTVDNGGTTAQSGAILSDLSSWGGSSGSCTAVPTVPETPSGTGTSSSAISVTWGASTAGSGCTVSYNLFRSTTSGFAPSSSNQIASGLTSASYADSGLAASTTYYYKVEAADGDGSSAASAQGSGTTLAASCGAVTAAPTGLTAAATSSSAIGLNWTAPTPPTGCTVSSYTVYGGTTGNPTTVIASGVTSPSYTNSGLAPSTTYYYKVAAVDADGTSPASAQAQATTLAGSCSAVPSAPTGLTATASSSSAIGLSWTAVTPPANCTISSYTVYGGTTANPTTVIASGITGTSYTITGLAPSTTYYYLVRAVDAYGMSPISPQAQATTLANISCTTVPAAPNGLTATAISSSSTSLIWSADAPPANCTISSYSAYCSTTSGFTPGTGNLAASGLTSPSYTITGLAPSTTYYCVVEAIDADGASAPSAQASAKTSPNSSSTEIVAINLGGPAVSNATGGDASFVAEEFFTGGGTSTSTSPVVTTGVTNAAPMAVYLTQRTGAYTYTIPGLAPGAQYTVLLHFAETYFFAAGKRVFNVAINGTTVLSNLDIFALVGENAALVEQFTATANSSGQIVVNYTKGSTNQPEAAGIEIRGAASACTLLPTAAPTGLTALASSPSIIGVNWKAATAPPNCSITYNLYASTTSCFTPGPSNLIASSLTGLSYSNTGLLPSTTYYYAVVAVDSVGLSAASTQASDTTHSATSCIAIPPSAPTNFGATTASSSAIALSWTSINTPANCTNVTYSIYGSATSGFVPALTNQIASNLAGTEFYNTNLPASSTYYYVIQAVDEDGGSAVYSQQVSAQTLAPPAVLTATAVGATEVDLVFPESTLPAPVTYKIYRSTTPTFTPAASNSIGSTQSNAYQDVVAAASTTYYYQVVATSPSGNSAPTGPVSATTLALGSNAPFFDASGIPATPAGDVMMFKVLNRTNGRYPDDQVWWSTSINGVATSNTVAAQPYIAIPAGASGRMSFYLGPLGLSSPYVDFIEYTIGATFFNGDTTRVDAFAVKLAFNLTCADGTNIAVGENAATFAEDRSATFQRIATSVPQPFPVLAQLKAPYSIPNPGVLFNAGGEYEDYYTAYIDEVWATNPLSAVPMAGDNASGLGNYPGLSAAINRHIAGPGTFNSAGAVVSNAIWGNPNTYYLAASANFYAQFWHQNAINYQQYGFPYDDSGGDSSDVSCSTPHTLVVAVGW